MKGSGDQEGIKIRPRGVLFHSCKAEETWASSHLNLFISLTKKEGSRPQGHLELVSVQRQEPLPGLTFVPCSDFLHKGQLL